MTTYHPHGKWLLSFGNLSILCDRRAFGVGLGMAALLLLAVAVSLSCGSSFVKPGEMMQSLMGEGDEFTRMALMEIRLPRTVAVCTAGFALGMAGCMAQTVFRNRLATPDILGINQGATLAIVAFALFSSVAAWPVWIAPLGAILAVAVLYWLCSTTNLQGSVLIVIGICLSEFLRAIIEFLMSLGALHEVQNIYIWMQGSFTGQGYKTSLPVLAVLGATLPVQFYLARQLEFLRLPTAIATGLGVQVPLVRSLTIVSVAVYAALAAAIGGPVGFVAMAAPVLTSTLTKDRTSGLWCSGLLGAVILAASDTVARTIAQPQEIAAGVITRVLGGVFLLYLLIKEGRR